MNLERKGRPLKLSYELTEEDVDAVPVRHAQGRRPMGAAAARAGVAERQTRAEADPDEGRAQVDRVVGR